MERYSWLGKTIKYLETSGTFGCVGLMVLELMPWTTGITLAGYANRIQHLPFCVDMILQATANLLRLLMLFLSFFSLISSSKVAKEDDICHVYCAWAQVGRRPRALTVPLLPSKT